MGNCFSEPSSPYQDQDQEGLDPNSSSRAINGSQSRVARLTRPNASDRRNNQNGPPPAGPATRARTAANPSAALQHVPLKPPKSWETKPGEKQWTRETLDKEREAWFHTRTSGREDRWQVIRTALEEIWAAGPNANGRFDKTQLANADAILLNGDIVVRNGDLSKLPIVLYDTRGEPYPLETHIVSDPRNMDVAPILDKEDEETDMEEAKKLRRRAEKGKGVAVEEEPEEQLNVRVRFSELHTDSNHSIGSNEPLGNLVSRLQGEIDDADIKDVMMSGRILKQNKTLREQGWHEALMVQVFLVKR